MNMTGRAKTLEVLCRNLSHRVWVLEDTVSELENTVFFDGLRDGPPDEDDNQDGASRTEQKLSMKKERMRSAQAEREKEPKIKSTDEMPNPTPADEMTGNCYSDAKLFVPTGKRTDCQAYEALYGIWPHEISRIGYSTTALTINGHALESSDPELVTTDLYEEAFRAYIKALRKYDFPSDYAEDKSSPVHRIWSVYVNAKYTDVDFADSESEDGEEEGAEEEIGSADIGDKGDADEKDADTS
ncbi:uncharacterized protein BDV14DRAFT_198754 [Aspergillus stella-maris]|uniref:uncharacterized protein n=1 Tax=Aspergillus stella-maris TaxID=1810926 RepID=UPI003CCE0E64